MCRWLVWVSHEPVNLGEVVLDSENSLLVQSKEAGSLLPAGAFPTKYTLNADGFGVGWYGGSRHRAAAFRSMLPAWNNRNLRELCRAVDSPCFFAHVRATGPAGYVPDDGRYVVNDENCHPFRFENILFQHNGCVRDFFKIRKRVLAEVRDDVFDWVDGKTDSEAIFALILTLLDPALLARADRVPPALLLGATEGAISLILHFLQEAGLSDGAPAESFSTLNLALTDGHTVVVTRYCDRAADGIPPPSLYYAMADECCWSAEGADQHAPQFRHTHSAFVCASEPLTKEYKCAAATFRRCATRTASGS